MPYLLDTLVGERARTAAAGQNLPRHAPLVSEDKLGDVVRVEIMASSFNDPGPDYNDVIAYDEAGKEMGRVRVNGY